ncbi:hypothetical protein KR032_010749 [Drosophila birchii]|nr:hypothetical protein KR032_010749 [Drosophila birchii]
MSYINTFSLLLLLLVSCLAKSFQNDTSLYLNRTRRLSQGIVNEDTFRLAKYVVSIRTREIRYYYGENHFCGGVIIAPRYVLTSAHCLVRRSTRTIYSSHVLLVVAGTLNRLKYQPGISFHSAVRKIFVPDNFTLRNTQDIGILELTTSINRANVHTGIARLPYRPIAVGTKCKVLGWGRIFKNGPLSAVIHHVDIKIINPKECAGMLEIKKTDLLCAMSDLQDTAQKPCSGDRGAPLMKGNMVFGIAGYLVECDAYELPSVYTDVYQSINWIRRIITDDGHVCHVSLFLFYGAVIYNFLLSK